MKVKFRLMAVNGRRRGIVVKYYADTVPEAALDQREVNLTFDLRIPDGVSTLPALRDFIFASAPRAQLAEYEDQLANPTKEDLSFLDSLVGQEVIEP